MKKLIITILFFFVSGTAFGENAINIPYKDFKELYKESIEKQVMDQVDEELFLYCIDAALYNMKIESDGATCIVTLSGTVISGKPEPINLFNNKIIVKSIIEVTGGSLLYNQGLEFLPSKKDKFLIKAAFFVPAGEDNRSRTIHMSTPKAIENSLSTTAPKNINIFEVPGVKTKNGTYHFSSRSSITIRYSSKKAGEKSLKKKKTALSTRFKIVESPRIILNSVSCFTSFEESGNVLSVLIMSLPPDAGDHFKVKSIPGTSIWSLKVNGKKMKVYTYRQDEAYWIIPLANGKTSDIELAMLRKGKKLGLRGRLETELPEIEIPSRKATIVIGLPPRIELMSFEGEVTPDTHCKIKPPKNFIGKPYYFSKSFYNGDGINIAISYKEPVKH